VSRPYESSQTIYGELRQLARAQLGRLPPGKTLQPTALVNEAWLRLAGRDVDDAGSRREFVGLAARAMRDILVEDARRKGARKRGGDWRRTQPEQLILATEAPPAELLALDEALTELERREPRQARIVHLRFFAGLTEEETAEALELSDRTVRREWRLARLWLFEQLGEE
jgi:RNA polymerase sigma factor (TIGR02999 family)